MSRGGLGTVEHFIAVGRRRSRRKDSTVLHHWSQDKRVFLEGTSGQQRQLP